VKTFTVLALALALGLAVALAPFASSSPDGLERVAADQGFAARAEPRDAPAAAVAEGVAAFAGTLLVFALATGVAAARRRPA
jgi:hypothetical protein